MDPKPLNARELKALAKLDRRLAGGRLRFAAFGLCAGLVGGLAWVALMAVVAPGFGQMPVSPPTGLEAHPLLEQIFYWLAVRVGPKIAICLVAAGLFGGMFALFTYGVAWRLLLMNHANLSRRALAHGQCQPQFVSPLLRRSRP